LMFRFPIEGLKVFELHAFHIWEHLKKTSGGPKTRAGTLQ
jgi:hypothetical protein